MRNLLSQNDLNSVVVFPGMETQIKYRGKVRECRIEHVETAKGFMKVFDITSNGYRTFTLKEIGK